MYCRRHVLLPLVIFGLFTATLSAADPVRKPYGIEKRELWTTSQVVGSSDPAAPYTLRRAFAGLKFDEPLELQIMPGSNRWVIAERKRKTFTFTKRLPDELYDLAKDPDCVNNLANDLAYHKQVRELRDRMMAILVAEQDPRALGQANIFDTYQYLGGRGKGFETWLNAKQKEFEENLPRAPASNK